jgi:hypothetical protein
MHGVHVKKSSSNTDNYVYNSCIHIKWKLDILKTHGKNIKIIRIYVSTVSPFIKDVSCPSETGFYTAATLHSTFHILYTYMF